MYIEWPCFCRTASLCIALKACKLKGSQIFSTLPAMCLVTKYHLITSIRLKVSSYSWKTENLPLPFGICTFISVFFARISASWQQFKTKETETPTILEKNSFSVCFCLFFCFILFFLLIHSALWLSLSVALGFGVGHFLTRCLGSAGNDDTPNESFSSWNLGNCSVLWLMLDFRTVAIIMKKRPWLWLGQWSWNTGELFLILCVFPLTLRVGDPLHLPKRWTQSLYICVHTAHICIYTCADSEPSSLRLVKQSVVNKV